MPADPQWKNITKEDIEAFVNRMFSDENHGAYFKRDGRIHKIQQPITLITVSKECWGSGLEIARRLHDESGIDIKYTNEDKNYVNSSIIFYQANDALYEEKRQYIRDVLHDALSSVDYDNINHSGNSNGVLAFYRDKEGQFLFSISAFKESFIIKNTCTDILESVYLQLIANSPVINNDDNKYGIEYLFLSALYDKSISMDEDEGSARSKIVQIMDGKIQGEW